MKRKSLILLASAVLGMGLIGGTLAAWAVTDNADPIGIKVSPGNVDTDTTTKYTTLEWGSKKSLSNVGNLKLGSKRLAGILDVRQSANEAFPGRLSYLISGDASLINVLHIDVYAYEFDAVPGAELEEEAIAAQSGKLVNFTVAAPARAGETKGYDFNAVASNGENVFSVIVYLDSSVTADQYAELASSQVDISFDWGLGSGQTPVTTTTYYLKANGLGDEPHAYAWKNDGSARNGAFPGPAMTLVREGYYSIEVDIGKYDKIIFNDGQESDGIQSGDIVIADAFTEGKNMFTYDGSTGTDKGTFGIYTDEVVAKQYYILGQNLTYNTKAIDWDTDETQLLPAAVEGVISFDLSTTGNARLKVYESTTNTWYSNDGNDFTLGDEGTYHMTFTLAPGDGVTYIAAVKA